MVLADTQRGSVKDSVADTMPSRAPVTLAAQTLPPGAKVSRYIILGLAARGGMGVVYEAYDPELSRRVALKLLRPDRVAPGFRNEDEDRMRREAQSLAQLAHPNVVAAYDFGVFEGEIFLAMEYVEGETLERWLRETRRPWREILARFVEAGRGLAAAHAAGLVHRDFKPENVLLGGDGRVRVVDFGLAKLAGPVEPTPRNDHLALDLTVEGLRMGTPQYMSPEQHRGENMDDLSDQFSFCVALYYGLYGQLPFEGDNWETLSRACTEGLVREPPKSQVPRHVHRALMRGLSLARADRFPSMDALLEVLAHDARTRRRRAVLFAGSLAVAAGVAWGVQHWTDAGRLCRGAEKQLEGVWDSPRRLAIQRGLQKTGVPYADATFKEVSRAFDAFAASFVMMHTDACEATRVRGDQTEEMLGLRMACLDGRLREVRELGDRFVEADRDVAQNAVRAVQGVPNLAACEDLPALSTPVRQPTDPLVRARVRAVRGDLARARSFETTGRYRDGIEPARRVAADAKEIGYRPLEAEALHLVGMFADELGDFAAAEESLRQAVWAAEAGRHDHLVARAWIHLMRVVGERRGRYDEARSLAPRVTAVLERMGGDEEIEASFSSALASLVLLQGRYADAERDFTKSLELLERRFGPSDLRLVEPLRKLAFIAAHRDESDRALELLDRALAIQRPIYEDHPEIATTLETIGNAHYMAGRYGEAETAFLRVIEIRERALGERHPSIANTMHNLGAAIYLFQGRSSEAVKLIRRAVAMDEELLGPKHPTTLRHLDGLALALQTNGQKAEALQVLERLLPMLEEQNGSEHPMIANGLHTMALVNLDLGQPEAARANALKSHRMNERMLGSDYNASSVLRVIGRADLAMGRPDRAIAPLEKARSFHLEKKDDPGELAWTSSLLGQALYDSKRDRARGRRLLREALAHMKSDSRLEAELRQLEGWMSERRVR